MQSGSAWSSSWLNADIKNYPAFGKWAHQKPIVTLICIESYLLTLQWNNVINTILHNLKLSHPQNQLNLNLQCSNLQIWIVQKEPTWQPLTLEIKPYRENYCQVLPPKEARTPWYCVIDDGCCFIISLHIIWCIFFHWGATSEALKLPIAKLYI